MGPDLATSFLVATLLVSCVAPAAGATCTQVDELSLQLPRPIQPEYAGFVVPTSETTGAPNFADECLQIKVQGGGTGYDPLQELKDGRADLAIAEGSYVAQRIASGESLTIVAGYYQRNGLVWIGMHKQNFPTLQALANKKVGVWCCGFDLPFQALMDKLDKRVPTTLVSQNPISLQQLFSGEVDLASAMVYDELARPLQTLDTTSNFLKLQEDLYVLSPEEHDLTLIHNVLVANSTKLASAGMRAKIVRFLKVVTKTWHFCRANEVACAAAFSEYGVPTPHHLWQMREANRFIFPALPGHGLGVLSPDRWAAMNEWLVASGALASAVNGAVIDNTLALDAGALDDVSQWAPLQGGGSHFCAEYGSSAYRVCQGNEHTLCHEGNEPSGEYDIFSCRECEPGRFAPKHQRMNTCLVCPSGRYSKKYGQSECDMCESGRFWQSTATTQTNASVTSCTRCPVGHFSTGTGASACRKCGLGTIARKEGTVECERCPFGSYVSMDGRSHCVACKEGMATLRLGSVTASDCVCPEESYQSSRDKTCLPCPEGMFCNVNSLESTLLTLAVNATMDATSVGEFPRLRAGFYSERSHPFDVYLCKWDLNCPGVLPDRCGPNMKGIACGQCEAGYYREGRDCLQCTGIDESDFNYPLLQVIFGPIVVLVLYFLMRNARQDWGSWWNEICNCTFTFIVHYQILGMLVFTFIQYPDVLASVMMPWAYLVDMPMILRLSCSKYADFKNSMIVKETAPGLMLAIFVFTYVIGLGIGKLVNLCFKPQPDQDRKTPADPCELLLHVFPLKGTILCNVYMAVFHTFYLTICFISLQLFMCYQHPTGDWSLLLGPEVFCYSSDEWKGMITESIFAVLAYIVLPITSFAFIVIAAPTSFHKIAFHEQWKFLFIKFKPDSFWWGVFHMLRTLLLCLTLVFSQTGSRQVYYVFIMLLFYAALLVIWFPWRHRSANLFDLLVTGLLLFFCALSAPFSRRQSWLDDQIGTFAAAVTFSPIVVVVPLAAYVGWRRISRSTLKANKAKQLQLAADCRAVFTKFLGLQKDKGQAFVMSLSAQDRDVMRTACSVIVAELSGHQPGNTGLHWRLVHQEQKSGARTWSSPSASSHVGGSSQGSNERPNGL